MRVRRSRVPFPLVLQVPAASAVWFQAYAGALTIIAAVAARAGRS
jgi:hypothetical protein